MQTNLIDLHLPHPNARGALRRTSVLEEMRLVHRHEQCLSLIGMPGIGKTTCAAQYADGGAGNRFGHVLWLDAHEHPYHLALNLACLLDNRLGGARSSRVAYDNCEKQLLHFLFEVSQKTEGTGILVIDNFQHKSFARVLLHQTIMGSHWKMVVIGNSPDGLDAFPVVSIPPLLSEEAAALFGQISGFLVDQQTIRLCDLLEGHPLAVTLYARLMRNNPALSVSTVIQHLTSRDITPDFSTHIPDFSGYDKMDSDHQNASIRKILRTALLQNAITYPEEIQLLKLFSLIPEGHYDINELMWLSGTNEHSNFLLTTALRRLTSKGLIQAHDGRYRCPELVKSVVFFSYWPDSTDVRQALSALASALEYESDEPFCAKLRGLAIGESLLKFTLEKTECVADLYHALNEIYDSLGDHRKALIFAQKEEKVRSTLHQATETNLADVWNRLGVTYLYLLEYHQSWEYLSKAVQARVRLYGHNHYLTARSLVNLGSLYVATSNFKQGEAYLNEAKELLTAAIDNPTQEKDLATLHNILGDSSRLQGQFGNAAKHYRRALKQLKSPATSDTSDQHYYLENLTRCFLQWGKFKQAEKWALRTLNFKIKLFGKTHRFVAEAHYLMALAKALNNKQEQAGKHYHYHVRLLRMNRHSDHSVLAERAREFESTQKKGRDEGTDAQAVNQCGSFNKNKHICSPP